MAPASEQLVRWRWGGASWLRLAQVALGRILEIDRRRGLKHEQNKAWLSTRLRFLKLAQDGMEGIVEDPTTIAQQIDSVQRELDQAVKDYIEVKSSLVTLDGYMAQIKEVFGQPEQHVALTRSDCAAEPHEREDGCEQRRAAPGPDAGGTAWATGCRP